MTWGERPHESKGEGESVVRLVESAYWVCVTQRGEIDVSNDLNSDDKGLNTTEKMMSAGNLRSGRRRSNSSVGLTTVKPFLMISLFQAAHRP